MAEFNQASASARLIDIGFQGPRFTWSNNRLGLARISARLDRAFVNHDWLNLFNATSLLHLAFIGSDHKPILLSVTQAPKPKTPFRFEKMWLDDPTFLPLVAKSWNASLGFSGTPQFTFQQKLKRLKGDLKLWNKEAFRNLSNRIANAEKEVIQMELNLDNGAPKSRLFLPLIDQFRKRLAGWKSKSLSQAGKLILVRHVLSSIPIYTSLSFPIPNPIIASLEKLMRAFLFSTSDSHVSLPIPWDKVCSPKDEGGLGIRRIKDVNLACQAKLSWRAMTSTSCWAKFMDFRYLHQKPVWEAKPAREGSCIWKSMKMLQNFLYEGTRWIIGNGKSVQFWVDIWLGEQPMSNLFPHLANSYQKVNWIINDNGEWDFHRVEDEDLLGTLKAVRLLPPPNLHICDSMGWIHNDLGHASSHPQYQGPIWIESDSSLVVNTINGGKSHTFREGNRPADKLASLGLSESTKSIFDYPPSDLAHYLNDDANEEWNMKVFGLFVHKVALAENVVFKLEDWKTSSKMGLGGLLEMGIPLDFGWTNG
ncbi:putative ribonuclease H protein [Acorus calamus]|uniref:Ribonuclease H protein n=1 Tax=Acorus calamus TaxID=4465 RepID=A0AAV9DFS9_ACOCL|nr:putative ribonuclease H protein [Acorus calamus]